MIKHTLPVVMEAIRKVVAERGKDYVYEKTADNKCVYAQPRDGAPSCIVGKVIAKLEPEIFAEVVKTEDKLGHSWSAYDFGSRDVSTSSFPDDYAEYVDIPRLPLSASSIRLLAAAQLWQDRGEAYRDVLAKTEIEFSTLVQRTESEYTENDEETEDYEME